MNIYKVEQDWNCDYETYSDFVCIAESEQAARETHPNESVTHIKDGEWYGTSTTGKEYPQYNWDWILADDIGRLKVTLIGVANEAQHKGVICASFHAG